MDQSCLYHWKKKIRVSAYDKAPEIYSGFNVRIIWRQPILFPQQ
jgi:hypothetical protein